MHHLSLSFQTLLACSLLLLPVAAPAADRSGFEECLLKALNNADDAMPVGRLKEGCRALFPEKTTQAGSAAASAPADDTPDKSAALKRRVAAEAKGYDNLFAIIPHRPNYLLFATYNDSPNGAAQSGDERKTDNLEVAFQVSFKVPLLRDLLGEDNGHLYAAYTMKSFWQAYNNEISSPFRATDHEPELFLALRSGLRLFGWHNPYILTGFSHQSNGRSGDESRSWNRLNLDFLFEKGNYALSIKPWYRLPEDDKTSPADPSGDDNPDIASYLGCGEITGAWTRNRHTVSVMLRNNLRRHDNRGAVEVGWSFPLSVTMPLKGYLHYFNGYGESLIDYDSSSNRIGFGLLLTDWL